jgi:hypothetical protein
MHPLQAMAGAQAAYWVTVSIAILILDYVTGPFIQFPILFVLPVAAATVRNGFKVGAVVAATLPLIRLSFFLRWELSSSWTLEWIDTAVDVAVLVGISGLVAYVTRQQLQIRVLEGMLPICAFCKRIRDEEGHWRQMESYITRRSQARFSHTYCEECVKAHYPEFTD